MSGVITERLTQIASVQLGQGNHESLDAGMCVMEAVAFVAGEPWSDHPQCASPLIAAFLRRWNDDLDDAGRQVLKPFVGKLVGTKSTEAVEDQRAWMVTDWMVRHYTPAWLDLAGCTDQAASLRSLPAIVDTKSCTAAQPAIDGALKHADAAWDAAGAAAGAAAWDVAGAVAGAAARDVAGAAARDAARDVAGAAARDAAGAAAGAAAWDAARDAAWAAAGAAAGAAARDAAWDAAGAAAGAAAETELQPTVVSLQASALDLLDRLIEIQACP